MTANFSISVFIASFTDRSEKGDYSYRKDNKHSRFGASR